MSMGSAVIAWFNKNVNDLTEAAVETVIDAGEEVAGKTRAHIATRGTAKSGKRGRIESHAMINSVGSEVVERSKDSVEVHAGYHDAPYYTVFQELGTSRVEAMYALTDAAEEVLADLPKELSRRMRSA